MATEIQIEGKRLIIERPLPTVARLRNEWYESVEDPELLIRGLRESTSRPDLFTFWQRLPDTVPKYPYYNEPEALSAIPLKDFDHWWNKQIKSDTRKKAKRAEKRGVEIKTVTLDDDLVRGVMGIFNETPMRRGRPFWHYQRDFESAKEVLSRDLSTSKFIGAYYQGELVGIVKLNYAGQRFVNPGLFLTKIQFRRDKYLDNALMAKTVEVCAAEGVSYLTYTTWRQGSHAEFLQRNGFERITVPRYWLPLTKKGDFALKLGLHRDVRKQLPEWLMDLARGARKQFYNFRYGSAADAD